MLCVVTSPKMYVRIGAKGGKRAMQHRSMLNELSPTNEDDDEYDQISPQKLI